MRRQTEIQQPGGRAVAPGRLALVQSFVNSVNVEFGPDEFGTLDGLVAWLRRHGLGDASTALDELDLQKAVTLREALRALLRENNGAEPDPGAHQTAEHIARDCPLVVGFGAGSDGRGRAPSLQPVSLHPVSPRPLFLRPALPDLRGVLGTILAISVEAAADGSWQRLKACKEHRCEWAFYDRSRNRGSRWCSMAVCGTRSKMSTYRQAKRTGAGPVDPAPHRS